MLNNYAFSMENRNKSRRWQTTTRTGSCSFHNGHSANQPDHNLLEPKWMVLPTGELWATKWTKGRGFQKGC